MIAIAIMTNAATVKYTPADNLLRYELAGSKLTKTTSKSGTAVLKRCTDEDGTSAFSERSGAIDVKLGYCAVAEGQKSATK
jgi:hypothetical protein